MYGRISLRIVDGMGCTVTTTSVAVYKDSSRQDRACRSVLESVRRRWTHCPLEDRAGWGYEAHDRAGNLISYA